jgi:hypothetical protein
VDTESLSGKEESTMPKSHPPYAAEFKRRLVEQVRAGRTPEELAEKFEVKKPKKGEDLTAEENTRVAQAAVSIFSQQLEKCLREDGMSDAGRERVGWLLPPTGAAGPGSDHP